MCVRVEIEGEAQSQLVTKRYWRKHSLDLAFQFEDFGQ